MTFAQPALTVHPQLRHSLTYIIGEPGVGKSTLAEYLTRGVPCTVHLKPFAHRLYVNGVYELGLRRAGYPGTDALSMAVQPVVLDWIASHMPFRVFAEGDRLGTDSFLRAVEELGYDIHLWALWGPEAAEAYRKLRGSEQEAGWVDGRRSKVRNLMQRRTHRSLAAGRVLRDLESDMFLAEDPVVWSMREARRGWYDSSN